MKEIYDTSGFSLIEIMVAAVILSIISLAISTILISSSKQQMVLEDKLAALSSMNLVQSVFLNSEKCTCNLRPADPNLPGTLRFNSLDTSGGQSITYTDFKTNCAVGSTDLISVGDKLSPRTQITSISYENLKPVSSGSSEWIGDLIVTTSNPQLKPFKFQQLIEIDTAAPSTPASAIVQRCIGQVGQIPVAPTRKIGPDILFATVTDLSVNYPITGPRKTAHFIKVDSECSSKDRNGEMKLTYVFSKGGVNIYDQLLCKVLGNSDDETLLIGGSYIIPINPEADDFRLEAVRCLWKSFKTETSKS